MKRQNSRAQNMSEYVIVIGIVSLAFIGMQTYMKRGIQGVVKSSADELFSQSAYEQKVPDKSGTTDADETSTSSSNTTQTKTTTRLVSGGATTVTTNKTVSNTENSTSTATVTE